MTRRRTVTNTLPMNMAIRARQRAASDKWHEQHTCNVNTHGQYDYSAADPHKHQPCCSFKNHGAASKLTLLSYTACAANYVRLRHCGEHMRLPYEALPTYCSTCIVGVIPELLNVVWMVVVMLLVVAMLD